MAGDCWNCCCWGIGEGDGFEEEGFWIWESIVDGDEAFSAMDETWLNQKKKNEKNRYYKFILRFFNWIMKFHSLCSPIYRKRMKTILGFWHPFIRDQMRIALLPFGFPHSPLLLSRRITLKNIECRLTHVFKGYEQNQKGEQQFKFNV